MARTPLRLDEAVPTQNREMLREVGCLQSGAALQLRDAHFVCGGEEFENPNAQRVGEAFEQVRLHLVQRLLALSQ